MRLERVRNDDGASTSSGVTNHNRELVFYGVWILIEIWRLHRKLKGDDLVKNELGVYEIPNNEGLDISLNTQLDYYIPSAVPVTLVNGSPDLIYGPVYSLDSAIGHGIMFVAQSTAFYWVKKIYHAMVLFMYAHPDFFDAGPAAGFFGSFQRWARNFLLPFVRKEVDENRYHQGKFTYSKIVPEYRIGYRRMIAKKTRKYLRSRFPRLTPNGAPIIPTEQEARDNLFTLFENSEVLQENEVLRENILNGIIQIFDQNNVNVTVQDMNFAILNFDVILNELPSLLQDPTEIPVSPVLPNPYNLSAFQHSVIFLVRAVTLWTFTYHIVSGGFFSKPDKDTEIEIDDSSKTAVPLFLFLYGYGGRLLHGLFFIVAGKEEEDLVVLFLEFLKKNGKLMLSFFFTCFIIAPNTNINETNPFFQDKNKYEYNKISPNFNDIVIDSIELEKNGISSLNS